MKHLAPSYDGEVVKVRVEGQLGGAQWGTRLAGSSWQMGLGIEERCLTQGRPMLKHSQMMAKSPSTQQLPRALMQCTHGR